MRKYRAWSKDRNEYIPQEQIHQLFLRMDGRVFWHAYDGFEDVTDKIDIEFSAGWFDTKRTEEFLDGQEVYEGDEIQYERIGPGYTDTLTEVVKFEYGRCTFICHSHNPIVIGNIHEEKESLDVNSTEKTTP